MIGLMFKMIGIGSLAIDDMGQIVIRIVISEYFACEVAWGL